MDPGISDDERIGPMLANAVHESIAKAAEHEERAQKARAHKEREQAMWINAPAELFRRLTAVHDWEIAYHEEQAQMHHRRSVIAAEGYPAGSPDERWNAS